MARKILCALIVTGALVVMTGADCSSPCEVYCQQQADCWEDYYVGDWEYTGYLDGDEFYEECLDFYDFGGGPGIDRTENNACKVALQIFDEGLCS